MTSVESTTTFTHSWSLYDLITAHNYLFHQETYDGVCNLRKHRTDLGPYRLLDLGYGNARYLAVLPAPVTLTRGGPLTAIETTNKIWDVILTGFAMHHLMPDEKAGFFMRENWIKLPPDQLKEACIHVHDYEYLTCLSALQKMAKAASLNASRVISHLGRHFTWLFSRSDLPRSTC